MAPNNFYTDPWYRYDLRPSKHRLGRIEAACVRNKSDFFLSMGLRSTTNASSWPYVMDFGCQNCQQLICKCKNINTEIEKKKNSGIHSSQWALFTKPCTVAIMGKKCTVCRKNFKCETDLQRHCIKRHWRKRKNSEVLVILKIGNENIAKLFLDKKYLLTPDQVSYYPSTLTVKSPNLPATTAEDCVKQINWPSLRIFKVEAYKEHSKNKACCCCHVRTVSSYDKNNNDSCTKNSVALKDKKKTKPSEDLYNPISVNDNDISENAEIQEVLRVTKLLPKFPGLSVNYNTFYDLANQLNEVDGNSIIQIKEEPVDKLSDQIINHRNNETSSLETTCDNYLDLPERNYTFEIRSHEDSDYEISDKVLQRKISNFRQQMPSVAPSHDAKSGFAPAAHNFHDSRDLLPEDGPLINWDNYLIPTSAGNGDHSDGQSTIIIKQELDLDPESNFYY